MTVQLFSEGANDERIYCPPIKQRVEFFNKKIEEQKDEIAIAINHLQGSSAAEGSAPLSGKSGEERRIEEPFHEKKVALGSDVRKHDPEKVLKKTDSKIVAILKDRFEGQILSSLVKSENASYLRFEEHEPLREKELALISTIIPAEKRVRIKTPEVIKREREEINRLFIKCLGNKSAKKQLVRNRSKFKTKESQKVVAALIALTEIEKSIGDHFFKLESLLDKIHLGKSIKDEEKLSISELGALESFSQLHETFALVERYELQKLGDLFNNLHHIYQKTNRRIVQLEETLDEHSNYEAGDIVFFNQEKRNLYMNSKSDLRSQMTNTLLKAPLSHAAVVCDDLEGEGRQLLSHIIKRHELDPFGLKRRVVSSSSVYRFTPSSLLVENEETLKLLRSLYGVNYRKKIQEMFQKIQNKIHSRSNQSSRFSKISNDSGLQLLSGLSERVKPMHRALSSEYSYRNLHGEYFNKSEKVAPPQKKICSQFVAETLLAAIEELDLQLREELNGYIEREGLQVEKISSPIFHKLFSRREKLERINPLHLLHLLNKKEALQRVLPEEYLRLIIKEEDLKPSKREEKLEIETISRLTPPPDRVKKSLEERLQPLPAIAENEFVDGRESCSIIDKFDDRERGFIITLKNSGKLYELIKNYREEIAQIKNEWKEKIPPSKELDELLKKGTLLPLKWGQGGAYILLDEKNQPIKIIKPFCEDGHNLHNRKGYANISMGGVRSQRVKRAIPAYQSAQTEALSSDVANILGLNKYNRITPFTEIAVISHKSFHDIVDNTREAEAGASSQLCDLVGVPEREKLCSVQNFLTDSYSFSDIFVTVKKIIDKRITSERFTKEQERKLLINTIDQTSYEKNLLFAILTGETDGNINNYHLKDNGSNFSLIKLDNALTFPERNSDYETMLSDLPHRDERLSDEGKEFIRAIPTEEIVEKMRYYNKSEKSIRSFIDRVEALQAFINEDEEVFLYELDQLAKNHFQIEDKKKGKEERVEVYPSWEGSMEEDHSHYQSMIVYSSHQTSIDSTENRSCSNENLLESFVIHEMEQMV